MKKTVIEPKIYALLIQSLHGQILHLGIHFSLDDAYAAARTQLESVFPHMKGEAINIDLWNYLSVQDVLAQITDSNEANVFLKTLANISANGKTFVVNGKDLPPELKKLLDNNKTKAMETVQQKQVGEIAPAPNLPTLNECVQDIKEIKNFVIGKIIDSGDKTMVKKYEGVLNSYDKRYILKTIEKQAFLRIKEAMPKDTSQNKKDKL